MKGMILAAGLGTRLKPWTDLHPKALALINGKTLLQRNIEYLQRHGIFEVIVNVHHFAGQLIDIIQQNNGWGSKITISDESGSVLETGGGLLKASWYFDHDFVLMNADILTDLDLNAMIELHRSNGALATLAVSDRTSSRYFLFNDQQELCGWKNINTNEQKPSPLPSKANNTIISSKAFSGIHVISPAIFPLIHHTGKFSMVDVYLDLCLENRISYFDHSGAKFIDVGKPENIERAETMFL